MSKIINLTTGVLLFVLASMTLTGCASSAEASEGSYVYICTGPNSYVYHSTPYCSGLNKCSTSVKKVPSSSVNRRGCKRCT